MFCLLGFTSHAPTRAAQSRLVYRHIYSSLAAVFVPLRVFSRLLARRMLSGLSLMFILRLLSFVVCDGNLFLFSYHPVRLATMFYIIFAPQYRQYRESVKYIPSASIGQLCRHRSHTNDSSSSYIQREHGAHTYSSILVSYFSLCFLKNSRISSSYPEIFRIFTSACNLLIRSTAIISLRFISLTSIYCSSVIVFPLRYTFLFSDTPRKYSSCEAAVRCTTSANAA